MSLIKLPCILVANVGLHYAFTPPSVAVKSEQLPIVTFWDWYVSVAVHVMKARRILMYAIGTAEAAALLAHHYRPLPLANNVLSMLLPHNNPQDLRLTTLSTAGALLIVGGALLRAFCYRTMHRFFTFEVTIQKGHELITAGPYSVVRHPGYSGSLAVYIGMFCWYGARGSWLRESGVLGTAGGQIIFGFLAVAKIVNLIGLLKRMPFEDMLLKNKFGEVWSEWARKVPYSLIPWVY